MSNEQYILVLNSGSSSLKFALYTKEEQKCIGSGLVKSIGVNPEAKTKGDFFNNSSHEPFEVGESCHTVNHAITSLLSWLESFLPQDSLCAVGHRVVHGGDLSQHTVITPAIVTYLRSIVPLAPLHAPYNLAGIEQVAALHPEIPQVACLDTVFHTTIPVLHQRLPIPNRWYDKGVRRYGFHGLSYEYISAHLKDVAPKNYAGRTIIAHLGNGASLCALKEGQSFDSTMGFSVLDGLVMGTRPGCLDPGVLLYWMREAKYNVNTLEKLLYKECGLLGISGISSDMAVLLASEEPSAKDAIDMFCHRAIREISAMIGEMEGVDAIVFTGGMGENGAPIRDRICQGFNWLGASLDPEKNKKAFGSEDHLLSTPESKVEIWRMPTDEEGIIVGHTCRLVFNQ